LLLVLFEAFVVSWLVGWLGFDFVSSILLGRSLQQLPRAAFRLAVRGVALRLAASSRALCSAPCSFRLGRECPRESYGSQKSLALFAHTANSPRVSYVLQ